jgi:hypothetical protein
MEDQTRTEQQLGEEQMQAITGGCEECTRDFRAIGALAASANRRAQKAAQAAQAITVARTGDDALTSRKEMLLRLTSEAEAHTQIRNIRQAINVRHPEQ